MTAGMDFAVEPERKQARSRWPRPGPWRVQVRYATDLTLEQYVAQEAWRAATLERCPEHPGGNCGLSRHGTYPRKCPISCKVARYCCPTSGGTFSLLPDCLAARMTGTLQQAEQATAGVEQGLALESLVDLVRPPDEAPDAVGLAAGVQWIKRRHHRVFACLSVIAALMPELFGDCPATLGGVARRLDTDAVLLELRSRCAGHLQAIPPPVGFLCGTTTLESGIPTTQQTMRVRR